MDLVLPLTSKPGVKSYYSPIPGRKYMYPSWTVFRGCELGIVVTSTFLMVSYFFILGLLNASLNEGRKGWNVRRVADGWEADQARLPS